MRRSGCIAVMPRCYERRCTQPTGDSVGGSTGSTIAVVQSCSHVGWNAVCWIASSVADHLSGRRKDFFSSGFSRSRSQDLTTELLSEPPALGNEWRSATASLCLHSPAPLALLRSGYARISRYSMQNHLIDPRRMLGV